MDFTTSVLAGSGSARHGTVCPPQAKNPSYAPGYRLGQTRVGLKGRVLHGVHIGATWRIRLIYPCAAAMRPFAKLLGAFEDIIVLP